MCAVMKVISLNVRMSKSTRYLEHLYYSGEQKFLRETEAVENSDPSRPEPEVHDNDEHEKAQLGKLRDVLLLINYAGVNSHDRGVELSLFHYHIGVSFVRLQKDLKSEKNNQEDQSSAGLENDTCFRNEHMDAN